LIKTDSETEPPPWQSEMEEFILNIIGGILASIAFLWMLLRWVRPNIAIEKIVMTGSNPGDQKLHVTVSNNSMQPAIQIFAELHRVRSEGKNNIKVLKIKLVRENPIIIPRYDFANPKGGNHRFVFRTAKDQNIEKLLMRGHALRI
jgi:hypothetical protein